MKVIKVGNETVKIMGSAITAFFYKQEFKTSFSGDLISLRSLDESPETLDDVKVLQMIWAMAKTVDRKIEPFINWLEKIEYINLDEIMSDVAEEATNACFRGGAETK